MKIFRTDQVREIDEFTIRNEPINSIDLMERASEAFTLWFIRHFDISHHVIVFAGPGNNGGDGLAISRLLADRNYKVKSYLLRFTDRLSPDCAINFERLKVLGNDILHELKEDDAFPEINPGTVIIDGIFGSGLTRPVTGFPSRVIQFINSSDAKVVSVDIPSGLYGEDNRDNKGGSVVEADHTVTFQFPFLSFFFAENYRYTGEWSIVNIGLHRDIIEKLDTRYSMLNSGIIRSKIRNRPRFSHKGNYGHALLITGSYGMMGAAVIAARACLRGGAGLVTAHVPSSGYQIIQTTAPEALVSIDSSENIISSLPDLKPYTAIGAGPGLSREFAKSDLLHELLTKVSVPLVIDADGLNSLACHREWYEDLPENTILTPHPREFDRLAGDSENMYERHLKQVEFAMKYRVILVLKGAYTIITLPDGRSWFNTTGNPGMATGGSGDVLTGLMVSLLAQSYSPADAALTAAYLHGLAADIAVRKTGQQSLIAGDITEYLGLAFRLLWEELI